MPGRNDVEMSPANSLHASAYYSEYNERFDLIKQHFSFQQKEFTAIIEPPYIHRPDRMLIVHQTRPMPLQPVKV